MTPKTIVITGNPEVDGLILKGILTLASLAAPWLISHLKLSDPAFAAYLSGAIVSVLVGAATFVWGYVNSRVNRAQGVQAGINLQLAGQTKWQGTGDGKVMPVPVTVDTAKEIVKEFGDKKVAVADEPALTNELNARSAEISKA